MSDEPKGPPFSEAWKQFEELLRLIDAIPEIENPISPLEWDDYGLPT